MKLKVGFLSFHMFFDHLFLPAYVDTTCLLYSKGGALTYSFICINLFMLYVINQVGLTHTT